MPLKVPDEVALYVLKYAIEHVDKWFTVRCLGDMRNEHFTEILGLTMVVLRHLGQAADRRVVIRIRPLE